MIKFDSKSMVVGYINEYCGVISVSLPFRAG